MLDNHGNQIYKLLWALMIWFFSSTLYRMHLTLMPYDENHNILNTSEPAHRIDHASAMIIYLVSQTVASFASSSASEESFRREAPRQGLTRLAQSNKTPQIFGLDPLKKLTKKTYLKKSKMKCRCAWNRNCISALLWSADKTFEMKFDFDVQIEILFMKKFLRISIFFQN